MARLCAPAPAPAPASPNGTGPVDAYWSRATDQLFSELQSRSPGLTSAEVARRLRSDGPNAIAEEAAASLERLALGQFTRYAACLACAFVSKAKAV